MCCTKNSIRLQGGRISMYKVLIADDETFVRTLLEKSLQSSDLPIEICASAGDGEEALQKALETRPDILVTDISMPFKNGLDLIKELQEQAVVTKNIIISGYDEFDYARTAIALGVTDYLLKPFMPKELIDVVEKIIRELDGQRALNQNLHMLIEQADQNVSFNRERILKAVLEGRTISASEAEQLGFFPEQEKACYLSSILTLKGTMEDFGMGQQVEEFIKLAQSGYFPKELLIRAVSLEPNKLAVCFCEKSKNEADFMGKLVKGLKSFSKSMEQYYDIVPYAALGRVYKTASGLRDSYLDALETWKDALNPEKKIRIYGEKKQEEVYHTGEVSTKIRTMKSCIRGAVSNGNEAEALSLLKQLMILYTSVSNKGGDYIFISAGELIFGIADDMEKNGCARPDKTDMPQLKSHMTAGSLLEIHELLEDYIRTCCVQVKENLSANRSEVAVHLVQSYIEEHLKDNMLSAEDAADLVHFSVSYLREIFKDVTGESFNEYLIRKRMEKAGELLRNTSMKVSDIAEQCGYDNQRYFSSSFKKFYGCTPTEFKEFEIEKNGGI